MILFHRGAGHRAPEGCGVSAASVENPVHRLWVSFLAGSSAPNRIPQTQPLFSAGPAGRQSTCIVFTRQGPGSREPLAFMETFPGPQPLP